MSGKVTESQINSTTFQADEFRKAVNYTNPKNKGYVRFEPNGQGGVKIAKVNNKVDMFINWRTNVDAEKNKAMRAKFVDAISLNLKWADQTKVRDIAESIKLVAKGAHKGDIRTDALSRKELQAAFKDYDNLMNTTAGRGAMIDNLLKATAVKCGLGTTEKEIRELKNRFFPLAQDWDELIAMQDCNTDIEVGKPGHMVMSESDFMAKLHTLELRCDEAVKRAQVENLIRSQATELLAPGAIKNDFGLKLSEGDKATLRAGLAYFLKQKGYDVQRGVGNIPGTGGMVFNAFIDNVLPELFKKSVNDVSSAGDNADRQLQMEANFSFDAILEEAESFMSGAESYMANPPKAEGPGLTGNPAFDAIIKSGRQAIEGARDATKFGYMKGGAQDIYKVSNMSKAEARELIGDMQKGGEAFEADGLLRTFTQKFLAKRGLGEDVKPSEEQSKIFSNTLDSIVDTTFKVSVGARLQHGSAQTDEKGNKVSLDKGMGNYIADMESAIGEIVSGKENIDAVGLMGKLMSCTLANIANRKVELFVGGAAGSLKLDKASEEEDKALLKATADAFMSFERTVLKAITGAKNAFQKTASRLLYKGMITQDVFDETLQRAMTRFANAHKAALHEFFLKSPVASAEEGKQMLDRIFKAQMAEATADVNNDLTVATFAKTLGAAQRRTLCSTAERVAEALAQPGLNDVKLACPRLGVDEQTARALLKNGELKRLWTTTLAAHLKDIKSVDGMRTITDAFVKKVVDDFNKEAAKLVKSVAAQLDSFFAQCEGILKEQITNIVENESGELKGYLTGPTPMTKGEKKQLINDLTAETLRFKYSAIREKALEILSAPKSFDKKDMQAFAKATIDDFETGGVERTMDGLVKVVRDRKKMVEEFLDPKTGPMDDIEKHVTASGVFGKGGVLENAGPNEKWVFVHNALKAVKGRMKALPLVYATGDKTALAKRVATEALQAAEKPVKDWLGFRKDFMKQCAAVEADFAGMGAEKIAATRDWVLMEILNGDAVAKRDVKLAIEYYRTTLSEELNYTVGKIKTSFSEYVEKVDKALGPAQAKFKEVMESTVKDLEWVLTPEAYKYLAETVVPRVQSQVENAVYRDPDKFAPGSKSFDDFFARLERDFGQSLYLLFDGVGLFDGNGGFSEDVKIERLIKIAGAEVLLTDSVEAASAIADIRQWLASQEGRDKLVASEKALLDYFAEFGSASFNFALPELYGPKESGNPVEAFRNAARDILKMHTAQMLYAPFDNARVGEAKEAFEKWVDSHGLSRFPDFHSTTAKDRIMQKFFERIKALQNSALEGAEAEPILSPAFIALVDQIIDTDGTALMIGEWKTNTLKALEDRYLKADDENAFIFNPDHPRSIAAGDMARKVARENREMILSLLGSRISAFAGEIDSADGIDQVRAALEAKSIGDVIRSVNDEVNGFVEQCIWRYNVEEEINKHYPNYAHTIERQLVKDAVGEELAAKFPNGLDDLLTAKGPQADQDVVKAVGEVKKYIASYLSEAIRLCRENDVRPQAVVGYFRDYSNACINEVKSGKLWMSGFFKKNGLAVMLQDAAQAIK